MLGLIATVPISSVKIHASFQPEILFSRNLKLKLKSMRQAMNGQYSLLNTGKFCSHVGALKPRVTVFNSGSDC